MRYDPSAPLPCPTIDYHGVRKELDSWIQTQAANDEPGEGSAEWGAELHRLARKYPSAMVPEDNFDSEPDGHVTMTFIRTLYILNWDNASWVAQPAESETEDLDPEDWKLPGGHDHVRPYMIACTECGGPPNHCDACVNKKAIGYWKSIPSSTNRWKHTPCRCIQCRRLFPEVAPKGTISSSMCPSKATGAAMEAWSP